MSELAVRIAPVRTKADMRRFVDVPFALYARAPQANWVPPLKRTVHEALDETRNPFYREATRACFVAESGGRVLGRIAAIENRAAMHYHGDRTGFWGFFECIDDQTVADALFDAAARWLSARGLTSMLGPMNPSTNHECGLLVEGFEHRATFMTTWNPPYYESLCLGAGLAKAKDLLGLWTPVGEPGYQLPGAIDRLAERALDRRRVEFRDLDPWHLERDLALCRELYHAAWADNWGFVPVSYEEWVYMTKDVRLVMRSISSFIATVDGVPAAFALAFPDYNEALYANRRGNTIPLGIARMLWYKSRARHFRVMALGVAPAFQSRGVLALFMRECIRRAKAVGCVGLEGSWLLEDNTLIVQPLRAMGARDRMRWRLYERPIAAV